MKKKITLLLATLFCFFVNMHVSGEVVKKIPLNPDDWDSSVNGSGADVYNEGESLVLEVMTSAEFSWQGIGYYVIDLDLDVYPSIRITTNAESTAKWNVKLFQPDMQDQTSPFGGDLSEYGTREFNIESVTGQSGVSSFELWLWAIDYGTRVIVDQLEFFGEGGSAIDNPESETCIISTQKDKLVINAFPGKSVSVYTITGQLVKEVQTNSNSTSIDVPSNLYIVKVGTKAVKVLVP